MRHYTIAAFYHFARWPDFRRWRDPLLNFGKEHGIIGTILIAPEGINGTIAGSDAALAELLAYIRQIDGMAELEPKFSYATKPPFLRFKVRLKKEIVTIGVRQVDPLAGVGHYVAPENWNALISDPDVITIDTRNDYEYALGHFVGAQDPATKSFGQFPDYVKNHLEGKSHKKLALYCTGGIRCEKATNFLIQADFKEVFHLKGGILSYLEKVSQQDSLWQGGCFVFDQRVSVGHGLQIMDVQLCFACRAPLSALDLQSSSYEPGVSCPRCVAVLTPAQKQGARERHHQIARANARGHSHLGRVTTPALLYLDENQRKNGSA